MQDNHLTTVTFTDSTGTRTDAHSGRDVLASMLTSSGATEGTGSATLTSVVVNPLQWLAFGLAEVTLTSQGDVFSYRALTRFDRRFDVTDPVDFIFAAEFAAASPPGGFSSWQAQLVRDEAAAFQTIFFDQSTLNGLRTFSGTLAPGHYALLVGGATSGEFQGAAAQTGRAGFDFNFDLAPAVSATPEPASLLLLGTGLVGLLARRSRRADVDC